LQQVKLFIQIPCHNEAHKALEDTILSIPQHLDGFSSIEIVIIDDGSTDETVSLARSLGVKHIFSFHSRLGLASAFSFGIRSCLSLGADVIVNMDADNQYPAAYLPQLVAPILSAKADLSLGARDFDAIKEFSRSRRILQRLGSFVVSKLCRVSIPDAATGFRAFSKEAARKINVFTTYTYTLETLVQASHNKERIVSVPIRTNPATRPSRLFRHPLVYVFHSIGALVRLTVLYNPLRVLGWSALIFGLVSIISFFNDEKWMSGVCFLASLASLFTGLVLDQISVNRRLLEELQRRDP